MDVRSKAARFAAEARARGVGGAIAKAARHLDFLVRGAKRHSDPVQQRRVALYEELGRQFDDTVRYGPFAGMTLPRETSWAGPDRAPMLLGLYEQEVVAVIAAHRNAAGVFVDLGAADGFYGVGVLHAGWFATAYCYEMSELGRKTLRRNAEQNGVGDRVIVRGRAARDFHEDIPPQHLAGAVILIDIEGGEFDLLSTATLAALRSATIVIELHPWVSAGEAQVALLKARAEATHRVSSFTTGPRDPGRFDELKGYSDTDRWLICSEDRPILMTWLLLEPR